MSPEDKQNVRVLTHNVRQLTRLNGVVSVGVFAIMSTSKGNTLVPLSAAGEHSAQSSAMQDLMVELSLQIAEHSALPVIRGEDD